MNTVVAYWNSYPLGLKLSLNLQECSRPARLNNALYLTTMKTYRRMFRKLVPRVLILLTSHIAMKLLKEARKWPEIKIICCCELRIAGSPSWMEGHLYGDIMIHVVKIRTC